MSILATLALLVLPFFSTDGNPYCTRQMILPFVCSDPYCSHCAVTAHNSLQDAYNLACYEWDHTYETYNSAMSDALDNYDNCMETATTPLQRQACRSAFAAEQTYWNGWLRASLGGIDNQVAQAEGAALATYMDCMSSCCDD